MASHPFCYYWSNPSQTTLHASAAIKDTSIDPQTLSTNTRVFQPQQSPIPSTSLQPLITNLNDPLHFSQQAFSSQNRRSIQPVALPNIDTLQRQSQSWSPPVQPQISYQTINMNDILVSTPISPNVPLVYYVPPPMYPSSLNTVLTTGVVTARPEISSSLQESIPNTTAESAPHISATSRTAKRRSTQPPAIQNMRIQDGQVSQATTVVKDEDRQDYSSDDISIKSTDDPISKRRKKNTLAARKSRQRKAERLTYLEQRCKDLDEQLKGCLARIAALETENQILHMRNCEAKSQNAVTELQLKETKELLRKLMASNTNH